MIKKKNYYNIHEAKAQLSRIAKFVAAGGEVVVGKAGKPVMILIPYSEDRLGTRELGFARGEGVIKGVFYDNHTEEDLGDMV